MKEQKFIIVASNAGNGSNKSEEDLLPRDINELIEKDWRVVEFKPLIPSNSEYGNKTAVLLEREKEIK